MKADKREIVTFVIAALATLVAVWFFLGKMQKEKKAVRTDLYMLVAPESDAVLRVNRPSAFAKYILSREREHAAFASKIPEIYLSVIRNNPDLPPMLFSFHPQGVVLYMQADGQTIGRIEKNTLQKQVKEDITFTYYPEAGNHFFGYYRYQGIWVASYSKKLLEEVARIQRNRQNYLLPDQDRLRNLNFILFRHQYQPPSKEKGQAVFAACPTNYFWNEAILFLNLSTRPPASTNFCFPVKKGWQSAQIPTLYSFLVDLISQTFPQAHVTVAGP